MKQLGIVTMLTLGIVVVTFAFITPNLGKGKDEVLIRTIRTWVEKVEAKEPLVDSVKKDTSFVEQVIESESKPDKPKEAKTPKKYKKVIHHEKMKIEPLRYSRSMQFTPVDSFELDVPDVDEADTLVAEEL